MKQKICTLSIMLFISIATFGQNPEQTDQIIIKLKNETATFNKSSFNQKNTGNNNIDAITQRSNAIMIKKQSTGRKSKQNIYIIKFPIGTNIQQVIDEYYKTGEIEYAEPDYKGSVCGTQDISPNDEYYFRQWGTKKRWNIFFISFHYWGGHRHGKCLEYRTGRQQYYYGNN